MTQHSNAKSALNDVSPEFQRQIAGFFMRPMLAIILTIFLLLPVAAIGEIQTITHTVKQSFGGSQSPDDARIAAVAKAKREAMELAGVYVEALTIVKEAKVDKDEILALTAGIVSSEVVSQKNYHTEDAFGIEVVVRVVVDPSILESRVRKLLQDRTHLDQLNQARKTEKELLDKMVRLEKENRRLIAEKESSKDLKKQFEDISQGLTAVDWFYKALSLWRGENFTDSKKVIEYLNQAIRLKPDYAIAYNNRGNAYMMLNQHQRAIEDFDKAIRLKMDDATYYNNRGTVYMQLYHYERAIEDFNEAIRLKPGDATYYNNRGFAYIRHNIFFGCRDFQKACELGNCEGYEHYKNAGYCR